MDRALKERIVGATVLVVIAVLVVPVFLDGPADEPEIVTETVTLPGQGEQNTKRQTIVLERDREQPVPAAGGAGRETREPAPAAPVEAAKEEPVATARRQAPAPISQPAQQSAQPLQQPPPEPPAEKKAPASTSETTKAATESATGMWAVQLGSFSNQANAERLAAELREEGYAAFLSRVQTSSEVLHRVRVGPQQNRETAEQVAVRLGSDGHKGQVVPHP